VSALRKFERTLNRIDCDERWSQIHRD
jgi:hypothetical protein